MRVVPGVLGGVPQAGAWGRPSGRQTPSLAHPLRGTGSGRSRGPVAAGDSPSGLHRPPWGPSCALPRRQDPEARVSPASGFPALGQRDALRGLFPRVRAGAVLPCPASDGPSGTGFNLVAKLKCEPPNQVGALRPETSSLDPGKDGSLSLACNLVCVCAGKGPRLWCAGC